MNARKLSVAMSVLVVVVVMVSACAPAATPVPAAMRSETASGAAPAQPKPAEAPAAPAADASADGAASGATTAIKYPSSASPYQANRLIIKNGEMNLMVVNTDRAIDQVTSLAVDSGGYIVSAKTWMQDGYKYATISLGVPSDQFEAVQRQLRTLAVEVLIDTASGQDVSDEYVDLQSRLTNLEATRARIREFLDKATKVEEALQVNTQLTEIEGEIEQVKGRMQYLKDRAAYSTLLVNIEQQRPTPTPTATSTPTPTPTPVYWMPEKTLNEAGDTLGVVLRALGDLLIWLVVVVAPLAVPVAIVALVVRRLRKKSKA
jgi:hypothetical protein